MDSQKLYATSQSLDLEKNMPSQMTSKRNRKYNSWALFCAVATAACATTAVSTALAIVDAVTLRLEDKSWGPTSIIAATTSVCSLTSILALSVYGARISSVDSRSRTCYYGGAALAVVAAAISICALVLKSQKREEAIRANKADVNLQFALWAVGIVIQVVFYSLLFMRQTLPSETPAESTQPCCEKRLTPPPRPPTPPTPLRMVAPPYALPQASSPLRAAMLRTQSKRRSSWRDSLISLQNPLRPSSSRGRLLPSPHTPRDTLNLDQSLGDATSSEPSGHGTVLGSIPGSRPVSPAKALNGLFSTDRNSRCSIRAVLPSPLSDKTVSVETTAIPRRTFIPAAGNMSPARSLVSLADESNIHPLFRTDSPTPPPAISPDTMVIAAPNGGQLLSTPQYTSHSLKCLRSPSQVAAQHDFRSAMRIRSSSIGSAIPSRVVPEMSEEYAAKARRLQSSSALFQTSGLFPSSPSQIRLPESPEKKESQSVHSARTGGTSRSSSPLGRPMTPPIPEFILSVSREGSRKGSRF